ncbi:MAG: S-layer homology domain-containing protein, partial [Clostridiales bacterium]|nr:S-layer homology domain-containing protein [Clostridiales bacterium]
TVDRLANFNVSFRWEGKQLITNYNIVKTSWRDIITTEAGTFTLDPTLSSGTITIIEDRTPGVNYYRGDFSWTLVYLNGDARTTVDQSGSFYGYDCPWSSTETHRMSVSVMNDDWGLQYEIRPSVTVNKVLQYTRNEPTAISFEGNYKEVLQNIAGLKYDIYVKPITSWDEPDAGEASIQRENTFEQLPEPDLSFMRGNAAEDDIRKLFAMKILDGDPYYYMPSQAITRGQFYTALAKTIKLPIQSAEESRTPSTAYLFNDVDSTMPEYPYIMAIVNAGIAYGRDTGDFGFEEPIQRQEAFVVLVRALGLTNLGLNPTAATFFSDDAQIADWAKREISVALQLGLIAPDSEGRVMPEAYITKGEAAALFNTFIEYMRNVLVSDYAEHIVNIAK